jgi:phage FluMu gp28-like protein
LVIDEAAHVDGLDELWTGLYPTLSTGGRCIALSTPNGVGNWFHQTYVDAEMEKMIFTLLGLPWDVHPDRDQEWFEKETRNMSRRK